MLRAMSQPKNLKSSFLLISNFFNVFGWALLTPLYALYATQLGASPQAVTFIWSFYTLLAGALMMLLGWAEDRIKNRSRLLTVGYAIQTVGVGMLFLATNVRMLVIALGIYAVGTGFVMPIWKVMYAQNGPRGREATGWGFFHGMNTLLISVAAAISGFLFVAAGFKGILGLMVIMHGFAGIMSFAIKGK